MIHRLVPSGAAVRPSSEAASLSTTHGRPVRRCLRYGGQLLGGRLRPDPDLDLEAGGPQTGDPPSGHHGSGSSTATTTRRIPEAMMASVQGGVRP